MEKQAQKAIIHAAKAEKENRCAQKAEKRKERAAKVRQRLAYLNPEMTSRDI